MHNHNFNQSTNCQQDFRCLSSLQSFNKRAGRGPVGLLLSLRHGRGAPAGEAEAEAAMGHVAAICEEAVRWGERAVSYFNKGRELRGADKEAAEKRRLLLQQGPGVERRG